jgi:PBP1b-binding outer membrane lipoprotein LpoB
MNTATHHHPQLRSWARSVVGLVGLALITTGCVSHVKPYKPKRRQYELPVQGTEVDVKSNGSIFDGNSVASRLMTDPRA